MKLLWSRRIGDSPATPSRWIHRLQMILKAARLEDLTGADIALAAAGTADDRARSRRRPRHAEAPPAGALRPKQLSVTRIEKLIRDPYAIYARHVLRLEPLDPVSATPDASRRGMIFHAAIGDFLNAYPRHLPDDAAAANSKRRQPAFCRACRLSRPDRLLVAALPAHRPLAGGAGTRASRSASKRSPPKPRGDCSFDDRRRNLHAHLPRRPHRSLRRWRGPHHRLQDRNAAIGETGRWPASIRS